MPKDDPYRPYRTGGMSPGDSEQFLLNNSMRAFLFNDSNHFLSHIVIDLDAAWYIPWDGDLASAKNQYINRVGGNGVNSCTSL